MFKIGLLIACLACSSQAGDPPPPWQEFRRILTPEALQKLSANSPLYQRVEAHLPQASAYGNSERGVYVDIPVLFEGSQAVLRYLPPLPDRKPPQREGLALVAEDGRVIAMMPSGDGLAAVTDEGARKVNLGRPGKDVALEITDDPANIPLPVLNAARENPALQQIAADAAPGFVVRPDNAVGRYDAAGRWTWLGERRTFNTKDGGSVQLLVMREPGGNPTEEDKVWSVYTPSGVRLWREPDSWNGIQRDIANGHYLGDIRPRAVQGGPNRPLVALGYENGQVVRAMDPADGRVYRLGRHGGVPMFVPDGPARRSSFSPPPPRPNSDSPVTAAASGGQAKWPSSLSFRRGASGDGYALEPSADGGHYELAYYQGGKREVHGWSTRLNVQGGFGASNRLVYFHGPLAEERNSQNAPGALFTWPPEGPDGVSGASLLMGDWNQLGTNNIWSRPTVDENGRLAGSRALIPVTPTRHDAHGNWASIDRQYVDLATGRHYVLDLSAHVGVFRPAPRPAEEPPQASPPPVRPPPVRTPAPPAALPPAASAGRLFELQRALETLRTPDAPGRAAAAELLADMVRHGDQEKIPASLLQALRRARGYGADPKTEWLVNSALHSFDPDFADADGQGAADNRLKAKHPKNPADFPDEAAAKLLYEQVSAGRDKVKKFIADLAVGDGGRIRSLGKFQAIPIFRAALQSGNPLIRQRAAEALAHPDYAYGINGAWLTQPAAEDLETIMKRDSEAPAVRRAAAQALTVILPEGGEGRKKAQSYIDGASAAPLDAGPYIQGILKAREAVTDRRAAYSQAYQKAVSELGLKPGPASAGLVQALHSSDPGTRDVAALLLHALAPKIPDSDRSKVVTALAARLKDDDGNVRAQAAMSLGKYHPQAQDIMPILLGALKDSDPHVQFHALESVEALGLQLKDPTALIAELNALKPASSAAEFGPALAKTLGKLEARKPPLEVLKSSPDEGKRLAAATALMKAGAPAPEMLRLLGQFPSTEKDVAAFLAQTLAAQDSTKAMRLAAVEALDRMATDARVIGEFNKNPKRDSPLMEPINAVIAALRGARDKKDADPEVKNAARVAYLRSVIGPEFGGDWQESAVMDIRIAGTLEPKSGVFDKNVSDALADVLSRKFHGLRGARKEAAEELLYRLRRHPDSISPATLEALKALKDKSDDPMVRSILQRGLK